LFVNQRNPQTRVGLLTLKANDTITDADFKLTAGLVIAYLFLYPFISIPLIVRIDSGGAVLLTRIRSRFRSPKLLLPSFPPNQDVVEEAQEVSKPACRDVVKMLHVEKSFGDNKVLDDVTLGVGENTVLGLLGPNGGGKTTSFNIIRTC
jgi:ATP-binding cassette, subfamily A (ABC1), member 3